MVMEDTSMQVTRLIVDNDESGTVTADLTVKLSSQSAVALGQNAIIMILKSATVHLFLPTPSHGHIALTHMSDSPICPTCLSRSNDTTSFKI
ncbi:hypothetical protein TNCV_2123141 [Trichonephila clavipes]|nr:hypothetical protein TNCV_2123141 [Trichonephila clavipes]